MTIRKIFFGLLLAVLVLPLGGMNASPAYGLLRSFHETAPDVQFESAYDIKVDQNGIYMVGARHVHDTSGKFPVDAFNPYILILEPDHRLRCTNYLEFPMDGRSRGMAVDLEHNTTHLIVSGYYLFTDGAALFVAAFDKNNCRLTGVYRHFLTEDPSGLGIVDIYPQFFGRGVDAAVDGTNIYVLTGLTIFENDLRCFLVIKLDSNLNYVSHGCFYVEGLQRSGKEGFAWFDFATSIAVASDAVYVVGGVVETPTLIELYRGHMRELFLLRLSKDSLRVEDFLGLSKEDPVPEKFFVGTSVLIDENDDIYIVTTDLFASRHDLVEIYKYRYRGKGNFERVWSAGYVVENVYTRDDFPPSQDGSLPPDLFEYPFSYSLSAALEGPYIFVGGFISDRFFPASALSFNNGFLSAIDKKSGNALFTFRIQPYDNPNGQTFVHGLTAYRGCAYIAGRSDNYRLEYVLQNILHKVLPDREARGLARETDVTHLPRQDLYKEYGWVPSFDQPNEVRRYS
ncbi:MAG: hypothetical protein N3H84_05315, partial [Candidatus Caldarchaeum sp.]|nr:hypothetical protein [Candidatus Caldarchaeum sp.]